MLFLLKVFKVRINSKLDLPVEALLKAVTEAMLFEGVVGNRTTGSLQTWHSRSHWILDKSFSLFRNIANLCSYFAK